jgi:hypothetical protein
MDEHLGANEVDLSKTPVTLGAILKINSTRERFTNSEDANQLLTRHYRKPFVIPEAL